MRIFAQDQGARKIFRRPDLYSEDKIFLSNDEIGRKDQFARFPATGKGVQKRMGHVSSAVYEQQTKKIEV